MLDNLKRGHLEAVTPGATFVEADLNDPGAMDWVFERQSIDSVMHLAADSLVGESFQHPDWYIRNNVVGGLNLLDAMVKHGAKEMVFSSSAAVYGNPSDMPITENRPLEPVNTYGDTKAIFERILNRYWEAYGLKYVSLRYFNVAGASMNYGEDHHPETHLIPNVIRVALVGKGSIPVYGTDYATRDGSCIRDYIHVLDIARAHIKCLEWLQENPEPDVFNLGNGAGFSVLEVINTIREVTGCDIQVKPSPRRPGDPERLVADSSKIEREVGWSPDYPDLESIIHSAWKWHRDNPAGYSYASRSNRESQL